MPKRPRLALVLIIQIFLYIISMASMSVMPQTYAETKWGGTTIYIKEDGRIVPSNAPIATYDYKTYVLLDDLEISEFILFVIIIEKGNIVFDGNGRTIYSTLTKPGTRGIGISINAPNVTVKNFVLKNLEVGIIVSSNNISILNNTISNTEIGIGISENSGYILVENNIIKDTIHGILLKSSNNRIIRNTFIKSGVEIWRARNNTVLNNVVNGKPLIYLENVSDVVVSGEPGQVIVVNAKNISITGVTIRDTVVGIQLYGVVNSTVTNCTILKNSVGMSVRDSSDNVFAYNNFMDNSVQVYLDGPGLNRWDDGVKGNYWSDHRCNDPDSDGVCNNPYVIRSPDNIDRYPLRYSVQASRPASSPIPSPTSTPTTSTLTRFETPMVVPKLPQPPSLPVWELLVPVVTVLLVVAVLITVVKKLKR